MTDNFFDELQLELQQGATKKGHPFRYFTLGTVGLDRLARLRTVVLRKVDMDLKLSFYTDARSKKIMHLKENNKVGLLFFHPKKLLQIKVEGIAQIRKDEGIKQTYWSGIQPQARKDYTTAAAPGSALDSPDQLEYLSEENHFCIVEVTPFKIEYLRLKRPNHIRVRFSKVEDLWNSEFLVP